MPAALGVLLLLAAGAALLWWRRRRAVGTVADKDDRAADRLDTLAAWPPQATRILNTAERVAYLTLARALPGHMILAQVPLSRFLQVPQRHSYSEWLRRLGHQCVDLVVCDMAAQVLAVVDVRGTAARTDERAQRRSARVARALKNAGVPLHVWFEGALPSADQVRDIIFPKPTGAPATTAATTPPPLTGPAAPLAAPFASPPAGPFVPPAASPFDDADRDSTQDEFIEVKQPPPSTWFDDLDSGPTPLQKPQER